jgi:hypothetical protein
MQPVTFGPVIALVAVALNYSGIVTAQSPPDTYPRRDAVECRERGGLPNALTKFRAGRECRVAYLGGSITAAPGWRVSSLAWLQSRYAQATLTEINAAIGGTGSDLGVFRHGQDVLRHRPDLLFVEFAVNDSSSEPARIHQAMEGIVRQTRAADPSTDIVFVYTLNQPAFEELKTGKMSRSASAMEALADHYGIPSIHLGLDVVKREQAGTLIYKAEKNTDPTGRMVFSTDGVHPLVETGHQLYQQALQRGWEKIEAATPAADSKGHTLGAPFRDDHWQAAKLVPIEPAMLTGKWEALDPEQDELAKRFSRLMPRMWRVAEPGAALTFRFKGTVAGIYDLLGPDGGRVKITLDDSAESVAARFDPFCTYHRLAQLDLGAGLDPAVSHRVTIALDSEGPDKAKILFEHNRPDLEKNPAKYAKNQWHAGAIMLIGDLD